MRGLPRSLSQHLLASPTREREKGRRALKRVRCPGIEQLPRFLVIGVFFKWSSSFQTVQALADAQVAHRRSHVKRTKG